MIHSPECVRPQLVERQPLAGRHHGRRQNLDAQHSVAWPRFADRCQARRRRLRERHMDVDEREERAQRHQQEQHFDDAAQQTVSAKRLASNCGTGAAHSVHGNLYSRIDARSVGHRYFDKQRMEQAITVLAHLVGTLAPLTRRHRRWLHVQHELRRRSNGRWCCCVGSRCWRWRRIRVGGRRIDRIA